MTTKKPETLVNLRCVGRNFYRRWNLKKFWRGECFGEVFLRDVFRAPALLSLVCGALFCGRLRVDSPCSSVLVARWPVGWFLPLSYGKGVLPC